MARKYSIEKFSNGMHFIRVDQNTADAFLKNGNKRIVCKLNKEVEFHCAILFSKEKGHYLYVGSAVLKKLSLKVGSTVTAEFLVDTTPYQFEMPEELKEVLDTDEAAHTIFHALTEGNQRGLIHLVQQVKSIDKKIERALKIAERIKLGITSPKEMLKNS